MSNEKIIKTLKWTAKFTGQAILIITWNICPKGELKESLFKNMEKRHEWLKNN